MSRREFSENPYVIFSCIAPVNRAKLFFSLSSFSKESTPIVITSKEFLQEWSGQGIQCFVTKFNSVAKYKRIGRSFFIRVSIFRLGWVKLSGFAFFKGLTHFWMHPHTARHFESLRLLKTLDPEAWAYLVGSRDLIFQISPAQLSSELKKDTELHFFDEGGYHFKDGLPQFTKFSKANSTWTRQLVNFDEATAKGLDDKVIINADCIYGKVRALCEFLEQSCALLAASSYSSFALLDQASTNLVAHQLLEKGEATLHQNGSHVLNMCGVVEAKVEINEGKLTLNNAIIPIVHQFDRYGYWSLDAGLVFDKREYRIQG